METTEQEFEELVAVALDGIPPELAELMDNVVVLVEAEPPADDPDLLGIYEAPEELVEEVRITVVHEIAHHFGIDDAALHDLGYA